MLHAWAELGHGIIGIDADPEKIAALAEGQEPFYEPGLHELLSAAVQSGRLQFSTSPVGTASPLAVHTRDGVTATLTWNLEFLRVGQASIRTTGS